MRRKPKNRKREKTAAAAGAGRLMAPFRFLAARIADHLPAAGAAPDTPGIAQDLSRIRPGEKDVVRRYYEEKLAECLAAAFVLLLLLIAAVLADRFSPRRIEGERLERPSYGEADAQEEVTALAEGEEEEVSLQVGVQARRYTDDQAEELLEAALSQIGEELTGENPSADEVRSPLVMRGEYQDGAVKAEWVTIPYGMIAETGEITGEPPGEGALVQLRAELTCQSHTAWYEAAVQVYPPLLTPQERFWQAVSQALARADEEEAREEYLTLPDSVEGRRIVWNRERGSAALAAAMLFLLLPVLLWLYRDQQVKEKARERSTQLMLDYSALMWKLTMLLGAGLTIRGCFERISREYDREAKRYVYEEVYYTCTEMRSGVAEAAAYERFGRRCGLPRYAKLGTLLSQNLKKGSRGLAAALEKEAAVSLEERSAMARKLGEQAGTKLVFPMIVMLGIVLILLLVPAFLTF